MTHPIMKIEQLIYTAKAHTTGGRDGGTSRTSDGRLDVKLTPPGGKGDGTNPEQLLAAGWSSCFLSAIKITAARAKVNLPLDVAVDTEVDLGSTNGAYLLQARFIVHMPTVAADVAQRIVDGAHKECPYSKAMHGNINIATTVITEAHSA